MKSIILVFESLAFLAFISMACTAFGQGGIVVTKRSAPFGVVSFSSTSVVAGISNAKHIDGYVKQNGSANFIFPVGDNNVYRPFAAAADETVGAYFLENPNEAGIPAGGPFAVSVKENNISAVSTREFWDINGTNATKITLTWTAASGIAQLTAGTLDHLTIVGWNSGSSRWEKIDSGVDQTALLGGSSSLTAGSITTHAMLVPDNYSIYTLASLSAAPLPVTLISFKASLNDASDVRLEWSTTSEQNSQSFEIQHSTDGKVWTPKGNVEAAGESATTLNYSFMDMYPVAGENLYRLRMVDQDGTYAFSRIVSVRMEEFSAVFYPNPASERLYIRATDKSGIKAIFLRNSSGHSVYKTSVLPADGIDLSTIVSGIYLVQIVMYNGTSRTQKILVTK